MAEAAWYVVHKNPSVAGWSSWLQVHREFCGTVAEPLGENPELQFVQPHGENVEAGQVQPGESGERKQTGK